MPSNTPLTDAIEALTRYANDTTGASDTTLSDAVGTLVAGYGGGGGGISADDWAKKNGVTSVSLTIASDTLRDYLFYGSTSLQSFEAENFTGTIPSNAFRSCTALTSVKAYKANSLGANAFQGCTALTSLALPGLTAMGTDSIRGCTAMTAADLGSPANIGANTFNGNTRMNVLIIRRTSSITSLGNINAFTSTPFASGGTGGVIYVPQALLATYPTSGNWATINGYGTVTWKAIEGSIYETAYADGTPIE